MRKIALALFIVLFYLPTKAQLDTNKVLDNIKLINTFLNANVDTCRSLIIKNIEDSKKLNFDKGIARSYLLLTNYYIFKGLNDSAKMVVPELEKSLKNSKDEHLKVSILLKIAIIYSDLGDFKNATKKAIEAQKIGEGIKDHKLLAKIYHDLGFIYSNKQLYTNSLSYFQKGLNHAYLSKDTFSIANMYARIGGVFNETNIPDSGLFYNLKSLFFFEAIKMKRGIGITYNNIAGAYELKKNYTKALEYYSKALPIRQELGDEYGITIIYYNLGVCNLNIGNYAVAEKYLLTALERTKSEKDYPQVLESLKQLCVLYSKSSKLNDYKKYADEYMYLKDSITTADNIKSITELQQQYETEKKEKDILLLKKENEKQEKISESERKNKFIILISGLLIVIMLSVFAFTLNKRFVVTKKQKNIIERQKETTEHQKALIEEKQKEILDSINYAKRLQQAILAPQAEIDRGLNENFLFYKPKDIVAGDFYFYENTDTHIFIAAADCTGHGVPGAMVSIVCCNALTRSVKEFKLSNPALILDKTSELVLSTFLKSGQEIKDGMDISLLAINKKDNSVEWAGANNPLWYVKEKSLIEIKADKQPIGFTENPYPFHVHSIKDTKNCAFYLFTDGYADQFGGEKGKKYKYKQLQDLIVSISHLTMVEQRSLVKDSFDKWRGDY
ncbi:MAG: tetratricopeptide repeat protein, partial [Bacteroidia bacterium]|nr:tetratricopeptide repeat protein [Bacteroidia bacterium]